MHTVTVASTLKARATLATISTTTTKEAQETSMVEEVTSTMMVAITEVEWVIIEEAEAITKEEILAGIIEVALETTEEASTTTMDLAETLGTVIAKVGSKAAEEDLTIAGEVVDSTIRTLSTATIAGIILMTEITKMEAEITSSNSRFNRGFSRSRSTGISRTSS